MINLLNVFLPDFISGPQLLRGTYASHVGLPWWLSSEESACSAGAAADVGSIPGLGRSPGGGHGNPLQDSWRIPWTGEPGRLQSAGLPRIRHDWSSWAHTPVMSLAIHFSSPPFFKERIFNVKEYKILWCLFLLSFLPKLLSRYVDFFNFYHLLQCDRWLTAGFPLETLSKQMTQF